MSQKEALSNTNFKKIMKKMKCQKILFQSLSRDSVGSVDDSEQGEGKVTTEIF